MNPENLGRPTSESLNNHITEQVGEFEWIRGDKSKFEVIANEVVFGGDN